MTKLYGYDKRIGDVLLSDLKRGMLSSTEAYEQFLVNLGCEVEVDLRPLSELLEYVAESSEWAGRSLSNEEKNGLDGWLAPRIHAALRLPRNLALDSRLWTWLALTYGRGYMALRWPVQEEKTKSAWRYTDKSLRNGLSRLWWGAEMVRDGADYRYVEPLFHRTRTAQFALELSYSHYRPAAIAFVRVAENIPSRKGRKILTDEQMTKLSTRLNAQLSLYSLEGFTTFEEDDEPMLDWYFSTPSKPLSDGTLPKGPPSAIVPPKVLEDFEDWLTELLY